MSFTAVVDACALYPASLRDTLLTAAESRLYTIQITDDILEEVCRNLARDRMSEESALTPFFDPCCSIASGSDLF